MNRVHSHIERPRAPGRDGEPGRARAAARLARDFARSLGALAIAGARGTPGVGMHARSVLLLARASTRTRASERARLLASMPSAMDSVRYFEFDFAWRHSRPLPPGARHLDASSPRLYPLCLIAAHPRVRGDLANPDRVDLDQTRALASAAGIADRCTFHDRKIGELELPAAAFDLVTSLSVLEHIPTPGDTAAIERLWALVRPGGRLVVSVPVAREAVDEYLDVDEYGLLPRSPDGWTFGQHLYDAATLDERLLRVTGRPVAMEIVGEVRPGIFVADRAAKNAGAARAWREPLAFGAGYRRFASIGALPGWGVAGLAFEKPR